MSRSGGAYHVPLRLPLYGKMSPALGHEPHRGKWKVQILCSVANAGTIRYNALRAKLDGISNTVLSAALRELEGDGLVRRQAYPEVPVRVEYSATERCMRLLPVLESLSDWAEAEMDGPEEKFPE